MASKEYVPTKGKKKKKKKKKKKNKAPQQDPHLIVASTAAIPDKPLKKFKRKTHFEFDQTPNIQVKINRNNNNNNFNRSFGSRFSGSGGGGAGAGGAGGSKKRTPRGSRTIIKTNNNDADILANLEKYDKEFTKKSVSRPILEIKSENDDDDDAIRPLMNIDDNNNNDNDINMNNNNNNNDVNDDDYNENADPWDDPDNNDDIYTPISLKKQANHDQISSHSMHNVFKNKNDPNQNQLMFIQLPPMLPLVSQLNDDEKRDLKKGKKVKQSLLKQMGEGQIGKLRIRKSGKTELVIGDYVLDVNFACPMDCYQQVMHIHCENSNDGTQIKGKAQFLGDIPPENNLVCSYRAQDLVL